MFFTIYTSVKHIETTCLERVWTARCRRLWCVCAAGDCVIQTSCCWWPSATPM